jgi:hypothetical protein
VAIATAATATVASTILVIVAVVTTLSLTLVAIARGMRWSRGWRGRSGVGVERLWGRRMRVGVESEFLQDQVIPNLVEGRYSVLHVMMARR